MRVLPLVILSTSLLGQGSQIPGPDKLPMVPQLFSVGDTYAMHGKGVDFTSWWEESPTAGGEQFRFFGGSFPGIPEGVSYPRGRLSLVVLPDKTLRPGSGLLAVILVNDTGSPVSFASSEAQVVQQAKLNGKPWRVVEFGGWFSFPFPDCGNGSQPGSLSPPSLSIPPHGCFAFPARRYRGSTAAQMRFMMSKVFVNSPQDLFSNEFAGSITPAE